MSFYYKNGVNDIDISVKLSSSTNSQCNGCFDVLSRKYICLSITSLVHRSLVMNLIKYHVPSDLFVSPSK